MAVKKEKILSYRRAEWLTDGPSGITLEGCLKQALPKLPNVEDRSIPRGNGQFIRLALQTANSSGGYFLHVTEDTPGEAASIVPKAVAAPTIEVGTADPPADSEFMDGDAFLFVSRDDVCLCSTGLRDGAITFFLQELFRKAAFRKDSDQFALMKVANISKVNLINNQGIKEIELRSTLYKATTNYSKRKGKPQGLLGELAKQIKAVAGRPNDVTEDALKVIITIRTDERFLNGIVLGEKEIKDIGLGIIENQEEGDDFVIVTKGGQRIGPKEIYVKSTKYIDAIGKSVVRDKAWSELYAFYQTLKAAGALEE